MNKWAIVAVLFLLIGTANAAPSTAEGDLAFVAGNYAVALRDWQQLASSNNASAMLGLGVLYDTGHGVPQNFATALSWYRRSADAGNAGAAFNVGVMYDSGRGTAVDRQAAVRWYARAAAKGYGRAAYNLGVIYRDGDGVSRYRSLAIKYFQEAARLNIAAARTNLAAMGIVPPRPIPRSTAPTLPPLPPPPPTVTAPDLVPPNPSKQPPELSAEAQKEMQAIGQFEQFVIAGDEMPPDVLKTFEAYVPTFIRQSSTGDHVAQLNLGFAYQRGLGVPVDLVLAYVYNVQASTSSRLDIRLAGTQGAIDVASHMSTEQQDIARTTLLGNAP